MSLVDQGIKLPRYLQVYTTLYQWVSQGVYPAGNRFESEAQLCDMFGVSRITIRKALDMLTKEGLLFRIQGKGTFVREDYVNTVVQLNMEQRISSARTLARDGKIKELLISQRIACESTRANLKLPLGSSVDYVSYVRTVSNEPIGFIEGWFRSDLDIKITSDVIASSTMLTILEDQGVMLSGIDHLVGASLADPKLAELLGIKIGSPLVSLKMVMLDNQHNPVECVQAVFRSDKYEHHMFMSRPDAGKENSQ
jgi:GntR family transcriptional regulator